MQEITLNEAARRMQEFVRNELPADEVLEVYNDLFPGAAPPSADGEAGTRQLAEQIVRYIEANQEPAEMVDLWNLLFAWRSRVWYNEEDDRLHFREPHESLSAE